ncbi:MAG: isocitrate/isopropylmalate family dehydrogenase, partial [Planctomycetes bacterium]|nr:isocitrate/isopropylmalate family dehydrogenase [Planctomycetota bacterium]
YADQDVINPTAVILSGVMMFEWLGWKEAGKIIEASIVKTLEQKRCTFDFSRQLKGATELKTSEYASALIENM